MAEKSLSSSDKSSTTTPYSAQDQSNKCLVPEYGKGNVIFTGMMYRKMLATATSSGC